MAKEGKQKDTILYEAWRQETCFTRRTLGLDYSRRSALFLVIFLYDNARSPGDKYPIYTFTIITTSSSEQLSFLHDRMPVIIESEKDVDLWLDPTKGWSKEHVQMLKPYDEKLEQ